MESSHGANCKSIMKNEEWNVECQSVSFGDIQVQFCEPIGEGLVQEYIKNYGEYPFAVECKGKINESMKC